MKQTKRQLLRLISLILVSATLIGSGILNIAATSAYDYLVSAKEPFAVKVDEGESVDLLSGNYQYCEQLVYAPQSTGLDLGLGLVYNSELAMTRFTDNGQQYSHLYNMYDIGPGWSFDIPSIDVRAASETLYFPGKGRYIINKSLTGNKLAGYNRADMILSVEYSEEDNTLERYILTMSDGTVYYLNSSGTLYEKKDLFGNTIQYSYSTFNYYPSGQLPVSENRLSKIKYVGGDEINISYVYRSSRRYTDVLITAPDNSTVTVYLESTGQNPDGSWSLERKLTGIGFPCGKSLTFTYTIQASKYNYFGDNSGCGTASYHLLNSVTYQTGAKLLLEYSQVTLPFSEVRNTTNESMTTYRVSRRRYIPAAGSTESFHEQTYQYSVIYKIDPNYIPDPDPFYDPETDPEPQTEFYLWHELVATINTTGKGSETYRFNSQFQNSSTSFAYKTVYYTYDNCNYLNSAVTEYYGLDTMVNTESYTHSSDGKLTSYCAGEGKCNVSYSYTPAGKLIGESYTLGGVAVTTGTVLTADSKNIAQKTVSVGGVQKAKTTYTYDSAGRLTGENVYTDLTNNVYIPTTYVYTAPAVRNRTVTKTTGGMKNADGTAIMTMQEILFRQ